MTYDLTIVRVKPKRQCFSEPGMTRAADKKGLKWGQELDHKNVGAKALTHDYGGGGGAETCRQHFFDGSEESMKLSEKRKRPGEEKDSARRKRVDLGVESNRRGKKLLAYPFHFRFGWCIDQKSLE